MSTDIVADPFESSQAAVAARIGEILDAVVRKDFERLAGYHLDGPKFTKFDDVEPLERQDAATSARLEEEQFSGVEDLQATFDGLQIDVFGPVAVATGVFVWSCLAEGRRVSGRSRTTLVFVDHGGQWLIAHEHSSPFVAGP
ncbi:nuclear transport factor 2 family protein [Kocuria flava]|uniref:nuclear transport factor 2 family protein n=1 Tax=Kocuria flava TaxID=446860 RepID=UPI000DD36C34|nr:nuclear transport factor 2 family protein [Kocuria flava]MCJ8505351.1 nuclear transport factor 2 family protein [Kocuria flava]